MALRTMLNLCFEVSAFSVGGLPFSGIGKSPRDGQPGSLRWGLLFAGGLIFQGEPAIV